MTLDDKQGCRVAKDFTREAEADSPDPVYPDDDAKPTCNQAN
jgi:hypothetical protein